MTYGMRFNKQLLSLLFETAKREEDYDDVTFETPAAILSGKKKDETDELPFVLLTRGLLLT